MVKLNINEAEIRGLERGIAYCTQVRGFERSEDGFKLHIKKGEHGLSISEKNGEYYIVYEKKNEFFRALSMLVGLIEEKREEFTIKETAELNMCGMMVDVSRGAVLKKDKAIDLIARAAMMGMNTFMLYTEDVYELDGYEYFGYMRGKYTKTELKEINNAAESLGVELIPCIQTLGHLKKALRWDYAADMKDDPDVLLIDEEKTYEFIEAMFKTWREVCSTDKIHIGMDEAEGVGLGEYLNRNGYRDRFEIMCRHVHRVCDIAKRYGFKPMMWSDMFFKIGSAKRDYYDLDTKIPEDLPSQIPDDVSMVYWDYYHEDKDFYVKMLENHKKLGCDIIFAGGIWTWRGMAPEYEKTFNTTYPALSACRKVGIDNIIATAWHDDGADISTYTMLLGMQLFAEFNFSKDVDKEKLKENFRLCTGYNADAFLALDFDAVPAKKKDALATSKQVFCQDVLMGLFDKNFACYDLETYYDGIIKKLDNLNSQGDMEYLFDYYRTLARILKKKCKLGIKIRAAYTSKDKEKIAEYAKVTEELAAEYESFYEKLSALWHYENKAFGFEELEERMGGLILRLKSTKRKLEAYADGRTDTIEELDENLLWYGGADTEGELLPQHFVNQMRIYSREN